MESISSILEKFEKGEIDETETEALIIQLLKTKISSEESEHKEEASTMSGMKELALKSTEFYIDEIGLSS